MLGHVRREQVLGQVVERRDQRHRPERHARVEGGLLEAADLEAAPARDAHRADVEGHADAEEGEHSGVERDGHAIDCDAPRCCCPMNVVDPRRELRRDVNELVRLHREVYESEFGLDPSFGADMATQLAELRRGGWPGPGEGLWLAEPDDRAVGSITLYDVGGGTGRLGHLVLTPEARGSGAGRRLVEQVLEAARAAPYERLELSPSAT